jgi:hypothetical protein
MSTGARFPASLLILLAFSFPAHAHIDPVTGQDYRDFMRNDGMGSCCSWHDCRPAHAPATESDGEMITDFGNNKYAFDPSKVVKRPSDDGNWHVCGDTRKLKCIIAPVQSLRDGEGVNGLMGGIAMEGEELLIAMKNTPRQLRPNDRLRLARPAYPLPQGES